MKITSYRMLSVVVGCGFAASALAPATALADDAAPDVTAVAPPPAPKGKPPASMTLPAGGWLFSLSAELGLNAAKPNAMGGTDSQVLKPASFSPDIAYGVTPDLTLGFITSAFALTGFRGAAGFGACVSGTTGNCPQTAADYGFEGVYSFYKGPLALAGEAGVIGVNHAASPSAFDYSAKLGLKVKYTQGKAFFTFLPSVWIGMTHRDMTINGKTTQPNPDQLWLPVGAWWKPVPKLSLGALTGVKGSLVKGFTGFGNTFTTPIGAAVTYMVNKPVTVGASWIFPKQWGGESAAGTGTDARTLQLWLTYAM